jgi:hypothetical protein
LAGIDYEFWRQVRIAAFSASNLVKVEVEGEEVGRGGGKDSGEECGEEEDGEDAALFE